MPALRLCILVNRAGRIEFPVGIACRYVSRELLLLFAAVFLLLLAVGLGARFIGFLQEAAMGRFTAQALWMLMALRVPEFVQVTAPFALCLAVLLTFGRLHAEREYVALASGGARPRQAVAWLLASALPVAALVAVLSCSVTPEARRLYAALSLEQLMDSELDAIVPGAFHVYSGGRRVIYVQAVDRAANTLRGVFVGERNGPASVAIWARSGRPHRLPTGSRLLELEDGIRYEGVPGEPGYRVVRFKRLGQRLERRLPERLEDVRQLPMSALDVGKAPHAAERQWRCALPLMTVVAALLAFGTARARPRADRFARLLPGVGLFVGYYLLLVTMRSLVADGVAPAYLGLWVVHGAMLALAAWLMRCSTRPN